MTQQSASSGILVGSAAGGVLGGTLPNPTFATNGTTPILGVVTAFLAADVTITTALTYYDGPSVALTAGQWFLSGGVDLANTSNVTDFAAKLWDGTTVLASGEAQAARAGAGISIFLSGVLTVIGTATPRISATGDVSVNGRIKAATVVGPSGNNGSFLTALRIA